MKKIFLIILFLPLFADAQIITTIAGGGATLGDGGPATSAQVGIPDRVAWDRAGNLYIGEGSGNRIRKISMSGVITTVAGNGTPGYGGDNGIATNAMLNTSTGLAIDTAGNIYISDVNNNRIRKVFPNDTIITYAGTGVSGTGPNGDGGPATAAMLSSPIGGVLDKAGNLFVVDANSRIRKISKAGIITTVVGNGVTGFGGDNGQATAAMISHVRGIAIDDTGNLYVTDYGNYRIRKINTSGIITTIAGTGYLGYTGDNGPATAATFGVMTDIIVDNRGNLIVSDAGNSAVRKISTSGIITTIAGNGTQGYLGDNGPATSAEFYNPDGLGVDSCNYLYICDMQNGRVRKVTFSECNPLTLAIDILATKSTLSLYPNPAAKSLTITYTDKITSITITNLMGQTIYNNTYHSEEVQVDVSGLAAGMYLVRINGTEVRKFVKE